MKALVPSLLFLAVAASVNVQAATPANTLVIAQSIDDVVSFDPAQGFELTTVQSFNSPVSTSDPVRSAQSHRS